MKISGNPLNTIPPQFREEKWPNLKKYVQSAVTISENWDLRKVVILGAESSGKTSLLRAIEKDSKIDLSKKKFLFLFIFYCLFYLFFILY